MPVVDASVITSVINTHEPYHNKSRRWLNDTYLSGQTLYAPIIVVAEVGAALSRGQRDLALAHRAIQFLLDETLIQLFPVTAPLGRRTAFIAAEYRIRGCDAVYVALAEQLDEVLVTLDKQQLSRGAAVISTQQP